MTSSNDFKFQELARILDATLGGINPEGLVTGQNALKILEFLSNFDCMDHFVSTEFMQHIKKEIAASESKINVREQVKKILVYPRVGYAPWNEFHVNDEDLSVIKQQTKDIKFKIALVEGKVYAQCLSPITINDVIFDFMKSKLGPEFVKNVETSHVTLVNSNVVADIGIDKVQDFINQWQESFSLETGKIKSTFSEDWSRFSECFVVEIFCNYLTQFIQAFSSLKKINPTLHMTFAIKPRDLFPKMSQ